MFSYIARLCRQWNITVKAQSCLLNKPNLFASLVFSPTHHLKRFAGQSENLKLLANLRAKHNFLKI